VDRARHTLAVGSTVAVLAATRGSSTPTRSPTVNASLTPTPDQRARTGATPTARPNPGTDPKPERESTPTNPNGTNPNGTKPNGTNPNGTPTSPKGTSNPSGPTNPKGAPNPSGPTNPNGTPTNPRGTPNPNGPTNPGAKAPGAPTPGNDKIVAPPAPTPTKPEPQSDGTFTHIMMRAADKLQFGDGAGCLKLLATLPQVPNDSMAGVEQIKIQCRMAAGDCVAAATAMQAFGKAHAWDDARIKMMIESSDKMYCPMTAEPKSRWGERAMHRLGVASGLGRSCKPVLDLIAKHNIVLPDLKTAGFYEVQCLVNVGDCGAAKAKYVQSLMPANVDPTVRPQLEESFSKSFHTGYKKCP
jgi:hypothetical protein